MDASELSATVARLTPGDFSVVITAHHDGASLRACLASATRLSPAPREVIVAVDGGSPEVAAAARQYGLRTVHPQTTGVARARNAGAQSASGAVVAFADSDLILFPDFVSRAVRIFTDRPEVSAAFGSYDAEPAARGLVSRFRNLLHHFTHQHGARDATTFWSGCGAVRREAFHDVGGFDEDFTRPSVEDIDLGYRLRRAGHRIALDPSWQVRHLKRWRLRDFVTTDMLGRAMPWTRLLVREGRLDDDLNTSRRARWSAGLVSIGVILLCLGLTLSYAPLAAVVAFGAAVGLNRRFYKFLASRGGWGFAISAIPLHLAYFLCAMAGCLLELMSGPGRRTRTPEATCGAPAGRELIY